MKRFFTKKLSLGLFSISLFLLITFAAGWRNGFSFGYSRQVLFCGECASLEVKRRVRFFGKDWEIVRYKSPLLKKRVFAEIQHSKAHKTPGVIESFECSFSFARGYQSKGYGNYWTPDKSHTWEDGKPFPDCQIWTNQSPAGFCLHDDPAFVEAFKKLADSDRAWSMHQLQSMVGLLSIKTFPGCLLAFQTNRNEKAIYEVLKTKDIGRANYAQHWGRDCLDYPIGGTNWPRAEKFPSIRPFPFRFLKP